MSPIYAGFRPISEGPKNVILCFTRENDQLNKRGPKKSQEKLKKG